MAIPQHFKTQTNANAPAGAPARPAAPYAPRHAGVPASAELPYLEPGVYTLEIVSTVDSSLDPGVRAAGKGSFKTTVKVLERHSETGTKEGKTCGVPQKVTGKSESAGNSKVKQMIMACVGFEMDQEEEFNAAEFPTIDPENIPVPACSGAVLWDAAAGVAQAERFYGQNPLAGNKVFCKVTRGNPVKKDNVVVPGQYYNNYAWSPYTAEDAAAANG